MEPALGKETSELFSAFADWRHRIRIGIALFFCSGNPEQTWRTIK